MIFVAAFGSPYFLLRDGGLFESLFVVHNNSDPSGRHIQANSFHGYQFRPLLCNEVGHLTVFFKDYMALWSPVKGPVLCLFVGNT